MYVAIILFKLVAQTETRHAIKFDGTCWILYEFTVEELMFVKIYLDVWPNKFTFGLDL